MSEKSSSAHSPDTKAKNGWWRLPAWILSGILAAIVLSVTASYTPTVMKRLIIFYVVYGAACGFVMHWLAGEIRPSAIRLLPVLTSLICLAGAVNVGLLSYRHFEQGRQHLARERPKDVEILETLKKASENDPEMRQQYDRELRQYSPRFDDYLRHRTTNMGDWGSPWPEILWGIELLLSSIAGGVTYSVLARRTKAA